MSDRQHNLSTLPNVAPLSLLGWGERSKNWLILRARRCLSMRHQTQISLPISLVMAALSAYFMLDHISTTLIAIWIVGVLTLCILTINIVKRVKIANRTGQEQPVRSRIYMLAVFGAMIWAIPFWFTGISPSLSYSLQHWAIALFVMMTYTMLVHSIPLACIFFITPVSLSAALAMMVSGHIALAIVSLFMAVLLSTFSFHLAHSRVRLRKADEKLRDKRETVSLLLREFESAADWLWQTDANHCLEQVSPRLAAALRSHPDILEGEPLLSLLDIGLDGGENRSSGLSELQRKLQEVDSFAAITLPLYIDGEKRWWRLSAAPHRDSKNKFKGFRGVGSDVTDQYISAEHMARLVRLDALTHLPNRLSLHEDVAEALAEANAQNSRCAMLVIDLDRFKGVNDTLGHPVGDQLLTQVAERLLNVMKPGCSCGRVGGDEFVVLIRRPDSHAAVAAYARHIITTLSRPYQIDGHQLFIGASAGYAMGPSDGANVEILSRNADLALYKSKNRGGNCVEAYVPMLHAQAEERRVLEQELHSALDKRELQIYYQPVVNAQSEQLVGFEALLRWNSAKLGPVSPARFIPIAEESRLINPIGEWVLRTACHEAMSWPDHLKVAVNVSAEQLTNPHFASVVLSVLAQSGLPPHRLEIEVTESLFMRDEDGALQILDQLLAMGVRLSLDDFGTGYSSFGYLRKARFSTVKVDRSFVSSAAKGSAESIAIIRAVVALADGLGMTTIAEGAETEEEVATVRSLGCRNIQGFFFGRPMTPASIRQYLPAIMRQPINSEQALH